MASNRADTRSDMKHAKVCCAWAVRNVRYGDRSLAEAPQCTLERRTGEGARMPYDGVVGSHLGCRRGRRVPSLVDQGLYRGGEVEKFIRLRRNEIASSGSPRSDVGLQR